MSSNPVLLKGGRIIDPKNNRDEEMDLLIEDGQIKAIGPSIEVSQQTTTIDCKGSWVLPGLVDSHSEFCEPGFEYQETIETGSMSAVAGGFTAVACMPGTRPVNDNPAVTAFIREKAKEVSHCRVFPVGALSKGREGEFLSEMGGMAQEGARAISDNGKPVMNAYLMRKAMDYARAFDLTVISRPEDVFLTGKGVMNEGALSNELGLRGVPTAAEEIMVAREVALCRLTGARVHLSQITCAQSIEHIKRAKDEGLSLTAEVSPHHLMLTEESVRSYATDYKVSPPLRNAKDVEALCSALDEGVIDVIASAHKPIGTVDKLTEFDLASPGIIGLQTAVPLTYELVHQGKLSAERWVSSLSSNPARLFGFDGGQLREGGVADVTVFDPRVTWSLQEDQILSKSRNTPFLNKELQGRVSHTFVDGRLVYECK